MFPDRCGGAANTVAIIKSLRSATDLALSESRDALAHEKPIAVATLFGNDHDEVESRLLTLLGELDATETDFRILVDGESESRQYLDNILQSWRETGAEVQMMTDLELGEPDIETLPWLQRGSPDVFLATLQQIVDGNGYRVDEEILAWAKQQLEDTDK